MADVLHAPGTLLLDTTRTDDENPVSLLFRDPVEVLVATTPADVPGLLRNLDRAAAEGRWAAGYLGYEAGYALEPIGAAPRTSEGRSEPLGWFGIYEPPAHLTTDEVDRMLDDGVGTYRIDDLAFDMSPSAYTAAVQAVRAHIREGDVYQVNFTGRMRFRFSGSAVACYRDLRRSQRVAYGALLNTGDRWVLSCSPELFFRRTGERLVTRPMKGTVRRGRTLEEDEALAAWLAGDEKSRAENLMIVDLLRNDLARCCRPGTVAVPALFATERYETVIQMTSTISGMLQEGVTYEDIFQALFPCGSVTGAPKIRAMQRIAGLEATPRGVYCGAIGYVAPRDRAVFNVAIRTAVLRGEEGEMGVGSGIVWDSDAGQEYEECLLKARFLAAAPEAKEPFSLIETMCWDEGIALLDGHLARIRASAAYFGYPFDDAAWEAAVTEATAGLQPGAKHRVRVTLDERGRFTATCAPVGVLPDRVLRLAVAPEPIDARDPLRFHKTTRRGPLEAAYRRAVAAGYDEVLFLNERGEVTEGSRTNVFVRRGGELLTTPVRCGLLGGVFRRHVLATWPGAREAVLTVDDLREADAVYVCNAVWGMREARLERIRHEAPALDC